MKFARGILCCVALLLFWIRVAAADEVAPPPITRETLMGVWDGMPTPPCQWIVYRLKVTRNGPSYLAFTLGSQDLVYRLVSSEVRLRSRFVSRPGRKMSPTGQKKLSGYSRTQSPTINRWRA